MSKTEQNSQLLTVSNVETIHISIDPEANARKRGAIELSKGITECDDQFTAGLTGEYIKTLNALLREAESSRKDVKTPILEVGRQIDRVAKEYSKELQEERERLKKLANVYVRRLEDEKAERVRKEREELAEKERKAREFAEKSTAAMDNKAPENFADTANAAITREQAVKDAADANARIAELEKQKPGGSVGFSTRKRWDYEIENLLELFHHHPELVELTPKRAAILADLKAGKTIRGIKAKEILETIGR